jgi:hypothetical protein
MPPKHNPGLPPSKNQTETKKKNHHLHNHCHYLLKKEKILAKLLALILAAFG